jgi:FkbM family methyltransferase
MKQIFKRLSTWGLTGDINAALKYEFRARVRSLARQGRIKTVYDIGAHHGNWASGMRKVLPSTEFYLFEANPACEPFLANTKLPYFLRPLSNGKGKKLFYYNDSTGDSFYRENSDLSGVAHWPEKDLKTIDLDSLMKEKSLPPPDWIKLDVQVSELDVYAGGRQAFAQARYVLCEIPLISYNLGAPTLSEVLEKFSLEGFQPQTLVEMHHLPRKTQEQSLLCQLDIFFERS